MITSDNSSEINIDNPLTTNSNNFQHAEDFLTSSQTESYLKNVFDTFNAYILKFDYLVRENLFLTEQKQVNALEQNKKLRDTYLQKIKSLYVDINLLGYWELFLQNTSSERLSILNNLINNEQITKYEENLNNNDFYYAHNYPYNFITNQIEKICFSNPRFYNFYRISLIIVYLEKNKINPSISLPFSEAKKYVGIIKSIQKIARDKLKRENGEVFSASEKEMKINDLKIQLNNLLENPLFSNIYDNFNQQMFL